MLYLGGDDNVHPINLDKMKNKNKLLKNQHKLME